MEEWKERKREKGEIDGMKVREEVYFTCWCCHRLSLLLVVDIAVLRLRVTLVADKTTGGDGNKARWSTLG